MAFLKHAIKHPGRMKEGAARAGMGLHEYMEEKSHSTDPSLRGAAKLGLRFQSGEFKKKKHVVPPRKKHA